MKLIETRGETVEGGGEVMGSKTKDWKRPSLKLLKGKAEKRLAICTRRFQSPYKRLTIKGGKGREVVSIGLSVKLRPRRMVRGQE